MSEVINEAVRTKTVEVEVDEHGIIRDYQGWAMGRLDEDMYPFDDIVEKKTEPLKWHELPFFPGFVVGIASLFSFVLGSIVGRIVALSGFAL